MIPRWKISRGDLVRWHGELNVFEVMGFGNPRSDYFDGTDKEDDMSITSVSIFDEGSPVVHLSRKDGQLFIARSVYLKKLSALEMLAEQAE